MKTHRKPVIGLALGGGSARGWSHIGVIRVLEQAGIKPDVVSGTSIGALVGAVYAAGELARFEKWILGLKFSEIVSYMDLSLNSGLLKGERLMEFFRKDYVDRPIEDLPIPFAAVATSLKNGAEVWLRNGSTLDAVRASIALPGLFEPSYLGEELLVDGGLVNPVPVSLARAMGADIVIAVGLSSNISGHRIGSSDAKKDADKISDGWFTKFRDGLDAVIPTPADVEPNVPSILDVITSSINIMQVRITHSRMAEDPADVIVTPHLAHINLLDFHRAKEAIDEGEKAMKAALPSLMYIVNTV
jgi:NTE family protein